MRKNNVWKQALALVLSATLVLGNVSPVSAAAGDAGTGEGAANKEQVSPFDAIELKAEGELVSDDKGYMEAGIMFENVGVEIVNAPIVTPDAPGATTGDDGGHGRVFKFTSGDQNIYNTPEEPEIPNVKKTGVNYLTMEKNVFKKYDFSNGVIVSFDIYPEAQSNVDWNYFFAAGVFEAANRNTVTATPGLIVAYDSQKKLQADTANKVEKPESFQRYFPNDGWINADQGGYAWNYFQQEANAHKWYNMKYIYTPNGVTIAINGVPVISHADANGYLEDVLSKMKDGQLRIGKGVLTTLEGYEGLMDNFKLEPVAAHQHNVVSAGDGKREPATCTKNGYVKKGLCTECGAFVNEILPKLKHDFSGELIPGKAATCTKAGTKAHYKCTRCNDGYAIVDETAEGGKKEVPYDEINIGSLGHDYETVIVKAKEGQDGKITKTCKNDASHTSTTIIPKADVSLKGTSFTYTGKEIKPEVVVTVTEDEETSALSTENYDVTYSNNTQVGTATVTVKFKGDNYEGTVTRTFTITSASVNPPAANLTLDKSSVTLYTGDASKTVTIKVTAVTGASQTVTWKSDNDKIAKVDNKGKITAVKAGTTNVRATANGVTRVVKVTVKNPTITLKSGKKKFTKKTVNVKRKKKTTLTVSVSPSKSGFKLGKMTSKQKKIAKVTLNKKGKLVIQGKKKGSFKIKITSGKATKTLTIKVK